MITNSHPSRTPEEVYKVYIVDIGSNLHTISGMEN
jgi:hypothetical protein